MAVLATVLFGFDLQGWITVIGGILLGLITLFTGYDHVDVFGRATLRINQQVGLLVLVASLATLVVEAQLASRRRYRDQIDRARAANATARERDLAGRERDLADQERQRASRRAQRQDRCTLAQLEFQFSANATTRQRLSDLIELLREYGELA
ncbi:MAG: hypothetical protein FJ051_01365 [Cyanobacteria bacterium M_surface_9_m1_291]|nr:hypothetical protein [Cyanobacteria bacterium M_surface_9_m1_291]